MFASIYRESLGYLVEIRNQSGTKLWTRFFETEEEAREYCTTGTFDTWPGILTRNETPQPLTADDNAIMEDTAMALRNRWIVTATDKHDEHATGPFCVMCRATCRVHSYHATLYLARKAKAQANREYMASIGL